MVSGSNAIDRASFGSGEEDDAPETMSMGEYVDWLLEEPGRSAASSSYGYVSDALNVHGTREVIVDGELRERPRVFDDPENDGENAVLGNTRTINEIQDFLEKQASGQEEKLGFIWGPTATGKSMFIKNMLQACRDYSKTEEGALYTLEIEEPDSEGVENVTLGNMFANWDQDTDSETEYQTSPVNIPPLSVFTEYDEQVAEQILGNLNRQRPGGDYKMEAIAPGRTDPSTKFIIEHYREEEDMDLSEILREKTRVSRVELDRGNGIGQLDSETPDQPYNFEKLMFGKYPLGVEQVPVNYSYSGALSSGSPVITRLDEADQYPNLLKALQEFIDEGETELSSGHPMELDTVPLAIANPDFAKNMGSSPVMDGGNVKDRINSSLEVLDDSFVRRSKIVGMGYLTNYAIESELIRRQTNQSWQLLDDLEEPEDSLDIIRRPLEATVLRGVDTEGERVEETVEVAPHTVEVGALGEVLTRLEDDDESLPGKNEERSEPIPPNPNTKENNLTLLEKAELYMKGYIERPSGDGSGAVRLEKYDFDFEDQHTEPGYRGMPVTKTKEYFDNLLTQKPDRGDEDINTSSVRTAFDMLESLEQGIEQEIGSNGEEDDLLERIAMAESAATEKYEKDILDAIFDGLLPTRGDVNDYVDKLDKYVDEEGDVETVRTDQEFEMELREYEKRLFDLGDERVEDFRTNVKNSFNSLIYQKRGEEAFEIDDYDMREEIDEIRSRVGARKSWGEISELRNGEFEEFEFDLSKWNEKNMLFTSKEEIPTQEEIAEIKDDTRRVKNRAIANMVGREYEEGEVYQDYSVASASLVAREVVKRRAG